MGIQDARISVLSPFLDGYDEPESLHSSSRARLAKPTLLADFLFFFGPHPSRNCPTTIRYAQQNIACRCQKPVSFSSHSHENGAIPLLLVSGPQIHLAKEDLRNGVLQAWMWATLAFQDIKMRYRGSILGPFWLTISTLVMVAAIGGIYPRILNVRTSDYLPYLATGLVIWSLLASLINEGCSTFLGAQQIIRQVRLPFSLHVFRSVFRNLIVFAHSFAVIPFVIVIFSVPIGWTTILIFPALAIVAINGVWVGILIGMASARYRDIPPVINSFVTVAFFATPVFWQPHALGPDHWIVDFNPLFAALDVMRAPLLGIAPSPYSWPMLLVTTALGGAITFLIFARWRARISYWAN